MNLNRKTREELNALSKEVFGASSRWQKYLESGTQELLVEEVSEIVPGAKEGDPDTERKVQTPVKREDGAMQFYTKHYTVEDVRTLMVERKVKLDEFKALVAKNKADQAAAKAAREAVTGATGSAV